MFQQKSLKPNDPIIIIGIKHPMRYAFSIASIIKDHSFCKVYVRRDQHFVDKFGNDKTMDDQFNDAMRMLTEAFSTTFTRHSDNKQYNIYIVKW